MKKIFTHCFLPAICCVTFISCSKEVKTPGKVTIQAATNTTSTTSSTEGQSGSGHSCGNGQSNYNSNGY